MKEINSMGNEATRSRRRCVLFAFMAPAFAPAAMAATVAFGSFPNNFTNATYDTTSKAYGTMAYPGAMRLLIGLGGEVWFTGDHYGEDGLQINAENVNPPPPAGVFQVTNVTVLKTNVLLKWNTIGGQTNVVQAKNLTWGGGTNSFVDISPNIMAAGGDLTNASYTDVGGATNLPGRVYRIRLVQ